MLVGGGSSAWAAAGLTGVKYAGYFYDAFGYFGSATVESDYRFNNLFTKINYETPGQNFDETYSVKYYGYFTASSTETYTFYTNSDDSSWLWIGNSGETISDLEDRRSNSNEIVDNSGLHGMVEKSGTVSLVSGNTYPILIYFGEKSGGDRIDVKFSTSTIAKTDNGTSYYSTTNVDSTAPTINSVTSTTS
ncbi:MAG: hypothetical protein HOC17_04995, partial [Candidatus Ruthia sp.]|nr:hypothetical protein [Candidatus Ruthturnera sp.]